VLGEAIDREILRQLGDGAPLADVLAGHRLTRAAWDASWQAELRRRAPDLDGKRRIRSTARGSSPSGTVEIVPGPLDEDDLSARIDALLAS